MSFEQSRYVPVITRKASVRLALDEINYLVRDNRRVTLYTVGSLDNYVMYEKIRNLALYLDERFFFCTGGIAVNLDKVTCMTDGTVFFQDGSMLRLSRESFVRTRRQFNAFLRTERDVTERIPQKPGFPYEAAGQEKYSAVSDHDGT